MKRLLALVLTVTASPALADTMIYNVNGIQVGADGQLQRFGGLVIGEDGKVEEIFQRTEDLNRPIEHEIDGGGRTLVPGLIDAHGHVLDAPGGDMGLGLLLLRLDLSGSGSLADVQSRLAAYAAANPDTGWILGRGWNQELWADKRFPNAADLDAIVAGRPVILARVDGHAAVANSAALKAAGITAQTADPDGGKIERDANGEPTGLLIDNAIQLVSARAPAPDAETMLRGIEAAQRFLLAQGLTTVHDMGTSALGWSSMKAFANSGRLKIRIVSYVDTLDPAQRLPAAPGTWLYGERLRLAGAKFYLDGALGSRGAWLKQPYVDAPQTRGLAVTEPTALLAQARQAAAGGHQVAIHAIGDRANAEAISIFEQLGQRHGRDKRWRIEHAQVVDPADIPRFAPAGIIASMQPIHQVSDRTMAEARLGPSRLGGAYAWQTIARSRARLAFGSDFPVEPPNPFLGLSAAVSRQDSNGVPPGGWRPHERVTFPQALAGFTRDAAYAGFAEDRIGSLEPGKWADFILVDRDVSKVDAQALARTQVLETWIAGKKVWQRGASAGGERGK